MEVIKLFFIFGTRPEAIKMAPLILELQKNKDFHCTIAVTGQHREMLDTVLQHFGLVPDYDLNVMSEQQTLFGVTCSVLQGLEVIIKQEKPNLILVHGDTCTTFTGALASFYNRIPVGHVEAGLRSYNRYFPYPEEINRRLTAVLSELHFAPTISAKNNLLREGIEAENIFVTGNTAIDALLMTVSDNHVFQEPFLRELDFNHKRVLVVETHRRENWGEVMAGICEAVGEVAVEKEDLVVVFPVHPNPSVQKVVHDKLGSNSCVKLTAPLAYNDFTNLVARSHMVITDSGGLQEEAPALGKPVLVVRDLTERPEAVAAGTVEIVGTDKDKLKRSLHTLLQDRKKYARMARAVNPYGDGKASLRIRDALLYYFGLRKQRPEEFREQRQDVKQDG